MGCDATDGRTGELSRRSVAREGQGPDGRGHAIGIVGICDRLRTNDGLARHQEVVVVGPRHRACNRTCPRLLAQEVTVELVSHGVTAWSRDLNRERRVGVILIGVNAVWDGGRGPPSTRVVAVLR